MNLTAEQAVEKVLTTYLEEVESQEVGPVEMILVTDGQASQAVKQQGGGGRGRGRKFVFCKPGTGASGNISSLRVENKTNQRSHLVRQQIGDEAGD